MERGLVAADHQPPHPRWARLEVGQGRAPRGTFGLRDRHGAGSGAKEAPLGAGIVQSEQGGCGQPTRLKPRKLNAWITA